MFKRPHPAGHVSARSPRSCATGPQGEPRSEFSGLRSHRVGLINGGVSMQRLFTIVFSAALLLIGGAQGTPAQNAYPWTIQQAERRVLVDDIAYYKFVVSVGPGWYDKIAIHRVVREVHPYQPAHLSEAVMFFAGEPTYFATLYIEPLIDQSIPRGITRSPSSWRRTISTCGAWTTGGPSSPRAPPISAS